MRSLFPPNITDSSTMRDLSPFRAERTGRGVVRYQGNNRATGRKPEGDRRDETRVGRFPPGPQERRKRQEYDPLHRRAQVGHTGDGVHHGADGQCPEVPAGRRDTVHI